MPARLAALVVVGLLSVTSQSPRLDDLSKRALSRLDGDVTVPGLRGSVQVIRDRWGIPHIYAASAGDLFFAQGYVAAQDRLWQMEMWRRSGEGRLAEIRGPQDVSRDRLARLLKYRGPIDETELASYHPEGR